MSSTKNSTENTTEILNEGLYHKNSTESFMVDLYQTDYFDLYEALYKNLTNNEIDDLMDLTNLNKSNKKEKNIKRITMKFISQKNTDPYEYYDRTLSESRNYLNQVSFYHTLTKHTINNLENLFFTSELDNKLYKDILPDYYKYSEQKNAEFKTILIKKLLKDQKRGVYRKIKTRIPPINNQELTKTYKTTENSIQVYTKNTRPTIYGNITPYFEIFCLEKFKIIILFIFSFFFII
jgi:hypothetical protein